MAIRVNNQKVKATAIINNYKAEMTNLEVTYFEQFQFEPYMSTEDIVAFQQTDFYTRARNSGLID